MRTNMRMKKRSGSMLLTLFPGFGVLACRSEPPPELGVSEAKGGADRADYLRAVLGG
jgi:hypothetical protein